MKRLGLGALSLLLLLIAGASSHIRGFSDGDDWRVLASSEWQVDQAMLASMRAQLPAVFETRARLARDHALPVPPFSDFAITLQGEVRRSGMRIVTLEGECRAVSGLGSHADVDLSRGPEDLDGCIFVAAYDADAQQIVYLEFPVLGRRMHEQRVTCVRDSFTAIPTLGALPPGIARLLEAPSDVAERGARFQEGDVIGPERLPWRRLAFAAASPDRVLVAVQNGGLSYPEVWLFERAGSQWLGRPRWAIFELPTSLPALLDIACE